MVAPVDTKMDLLKMQKMMMEEYGEENCEFETLKKIAMVTFKKVDSGRIMGTSLGRTVYRDHDSEHIIGENETWFCELKQNIKSPHIYFAKAILKVDASFLYDLRKDQYDELMDVIWENHRGDIGTDLEVMYAETIEDRANSMAEERVESLTGTIKVLEDRVSKYESRIHELESDTSLEELTLRFEDLRASEGLLRERAEQAETLIQNLREENIRLREGLEESKHRVVNNEARGHAESVIRADANTIYSSRFADGKYKVRFSANGNVMHVSPDEKGDVICTDNVLRLNGLETISPFISPVEMAYKTADGDLTIISLK